MFEFINATYVIKSTAAIFVIWLFLKLLSSFLRRRKYRLPPGPFAFPLVGHVGAVNHVTLLNHRKKYGDISYVRLLGTDIVILNSVDIIRDAFKNDQTAEVFSARPDSFSRRHLMQDDVVLRSMDEHMWKPLRQIFHSLVKQYGEGVVELEKIVSEELNVLIGELNDKIDQEIDMEDFTKKSLINILSSLTLGERYERDHWMMKTLLGMYHQFNVLQHPFVDLLMRTFPALLYIPIGPGSVHRELYYSVQRLLTYIYRDRKNMSGNELKSRTGLVYEMIKLREKNPWLTDSMIEGMVQDLYGAGFLTTDASLRAFFLLMLHYPDIQKRIQSEIDEVVGPDRQPDLSDRPKMPFTVATILELSRFSSVVSMSVPHACSKDTNFRGYTVPRDAIIIPNLFLLHHDPEQWENPGIFDPTRFLDNNGDVLPASHERRRNLIPFGVGKRVCLGEVFAKTRIFLFITYLLQTFNFKPNASLPSCDPREFETGVVLEPPHYRLKIERRI